MPNLRIIHTNVLTQVAGSATHPAMNDYKSQASTAGTSFALTTASISGNIAIVAYLPEHTGSITMTITGLLPAVTESTVSAPTTLPNAYGGGKYVAVYLTGVSARTTFTVTFSASVKVSRFIVGNYWSPEYNIPFGITTGYTDTTTSERLQSGDLYSTPGPRNKTMQFELQYLTDSDKYQFFSILKNVGKLGSLFVSAFPEDTDKEREQMFSIYGKLTNLNAISYAQYTRYATSVELEEF
jgi:hypothetical protein